MSIYPHSFQIIISQSWVYQEKFFYSFFPPLRVNYSQNACQARTHVRTHAHTRVCTYLGIIMLARSWSCYLFKQTKESLAYSFHNYL